MSYLLELQNVTKEYKDLMAVDHVSFTVPSSCIFGLLGPNGAGKTSLIRMITGITNADSGFIFLHGKETRMVKNASIGYMPEERGLYKKMKVGEQLVYLTRLRGFTKDDAYQKVVYWLQKFEIESWWNKKVEELSKGMSQKIQFIATVVHDPTLIILDEPFSGLDPINTNLIKDQIIDLKNKGASILFSTHRMEQVEEMCENIVLMNKGKIVLSGPVHDIRNQYKENKYEIITVDALPQDLASQFHCDVKAPNHGIYTLESNQSTNSLLQSLMNSGGNIVSFKELLPTFNEIFIRTVNMDNHE